MHGETRFPKGFGENLQHSYSESRGGELAGEQVRIGVQNDLLHLDALRHHFEFLGRLLRDSGKPSFIGGFDAAESDECVGEFLPALSLRFISDADLDWFRDFVGK